MEKCRDGCLRRFEVNGSGGEVNNRVFGLAVDAQLMAAIAAEMAAAAVDSQTTYGRRVLLQGSD